MGGLQKNKINKTKFTTVVIIGAVLTSTYKRHPEANLNEFHTVSKTMTYTVLAAISFT